MDNLFIAIINSRRYTAVLKSPLDCVFISKFWFCGAFCLESQNSCKSKSSMYNQRWEMN